MIDKNKKGWYFRIRVYDYQLNKNVEVYRSGFPTKKEAEIASIKMKSDYQPREIRILERSLFEEVYQSYLLKRKKEKKITSFYNMVPTLEKNILTYYKTYNINQINQIVFRNWINELDARDLNIDYKNSILREMKGIAVFIRKNYRVDLSFIEDEPSFRNDNFDLKEKEYYTLKQFNALIEVVDDGLYKAMFNSLFYTGIRLGELRALKWNDFKSKYFIIEKSINTRMIKHIGKPMITAPKTKKSNRTVPIPESAMESILIHYEDCKTKAGFTNSWYIFGDTYPIAENTIRNRLRMYAAKANIPYLNPHGFRHSYTTLLYRMGVSEMIASKTLGHESIATTRDIYTHISNEEKDDEILDAFSKLEKQKKAV